MKRNLFALFLLVITLLTGCATPGPEAYVPLNTTVNGVENHDLLVLLDSRIQYSISCPAIQQQTASDGHLDLTAQLRNREDHPIQVQVNCVFRDAEGHQVKDDDSPFQNLTLKDSTPQSVHFSSHKVNATRYTLCIRQSQ